VYVCVCVCVGVCVGVDKCAVVCVLLLDLRCSICDRFVRGLFSDEKEYRGGTTSESGVPEIYLFTYWYDAERLSRRPLVFFSLFSECSPGRVCIFLVLNSVVAVHVCSPFRVVTQIPTSKIGRSMWCYVVFGLCGVRSLVRYVWCACGMHSKCALEVDQ
jgi:hypothetical protein